MPDHISGADSTHNWHLYRIPLNDTVTGIDTIAGKPRWERIKFIRLFWTQFDSTKKTRLNKLQFAAIQVVSNEWQEAPAISLDSAQRIIKLQSASINTYDNPDYVPPPGITVTTDDQGEGIVAEA